jgi:hypothetical protein
MKIAILNGLCLLFLTTLLSCVSLFAGYFCIKNPQSVIRFQQAFYAKINWRIEPINLRKEIKNTKIMGLILVILSVITYLITFL